PSMSLSELGYLRLITAVYRSTSMRVDATGRQLGPTDVGTPHPVALLPRNSVLSHKVQVCSSWRTPADKSTLKRGACSATLDMRQGMVRHSSFAHSGPLTRPR